MKAVANLMVSLALVLGGGTFGLKAPQYIEGVAKVRVQKGLSPLSGYTSQLTCLRYNASGDLEKITTGGCRR